MFRLASCFRYISSFDVTSALTHSAGIDTEDDSFDYSIFVGFDMDNNGNNIFFGDDESVFNYAILDTGCPTSVCSQTWWQKLQSKHPDRVRTVETQKRTFRFGAEKERISSKVLILDCLIGEAPVKINFYVLDTPIPPLVSASTMRKLGTSINYQTDTITFGKIGQVIQMIDQTGHIRIDVINGAKQSTKMFFANEDSWDFDWNTSTY